MDLELRFKQLQEEKTYFENELEEQENQSTYQNDNTQTQIHKTHRMLAEKEKELKDIDASVYAYKTILDEKDIELEQLRKEQQIFENNNIEITKHIHKLEDEVRVIDEERLKVEKEVEDLGIVNEQLKNNCVKLANRAKSTEQDVISLKRGIEESETHLEIIGRQKLQKELELDTSINIKQTNSVEADRLNLINGEIEMEIRSLNVQVEDLESKVVKFNQQYDDCVFVLDSKDKECARLKSLHNYAEDKNLVVKGELQKAQKENDTLQRFLDQYRADVNFQKKLHEIESVKKAELELEKKRLENEAINKKIEVHKTKEQLERVKDTHVSLLEDKMQMNEELKALKHHTEVLHNQNRQLNNELDNFVNTDEVVRKDLDRKYRVEYVKSKNTEAFERSIERVRKSMSPERHTTSSYRSPSKY